MPPARRSSTIDRLRGLLMALMAVDHAAFFLARRHGGEFWGIPLPQYDSAAWFLTRWVTHLCAPGFVLLMGTSMVYHETARRSEGWTTERIRRSWLVRGLLLVALQLLVENPAWLVGSLNGAPETPVPGAAGAPIRFHFGVLYALGVSMMVGAFMLRWPRPLLALVGVVFTIGTAAILPGPEWAAQPLSSLSRLLFIPGRTGDLQVFYPALPWIGVTAFGILLGRELRRDRALALRLAPAIGAMALALFALLRMRGLRSGAAADLMNVNLQLQPGWIGFLNVTKYPPAPTFLLLTIGLDLLLLALLARVTLGPAGRILETFGRTALFFYLLHLWFFALLSIVVPKVGLVPMYLLWLIALLVLYLACVRYARFKEGTAPGSIWRLF